MNLRVGLLLSLFLISCKTDEVVVPADTSTTAIVDLSADLSVPATFYSMPYPSDSRLTEGGAPDLRGFPLNESNELTPALRAAAVDHIGFPVVSVGYFAFSRALAQRDAQTVVPASADSAVLLIDVDPDSPERGTLFPTVTHVPRRDAYVNANLLEVAPRPGFVLTAGRKYAFVVTNAVLDVDGNPVKAAPAITALAHGELPAGPNAAALQTLYEPLWTTLETAGVDLDTVVSATVFTTGDVVQELADLSDALIARYTTTIDNLAVDPDDGASHPDYCELKGTMVVPQFQHGVPPFDTEGLFDNDDNGLPSRQRDETVPLTITIPNGPMPAGGYPITLYFHGSGGLSTAIADRGNWRPVTDFSVCPEPRVYSWDGVDGCFTKGDGPAAVLAPQGFAMAGAALPVNPERLPGADDTAYLNFNNLTEGRDLFRQGVIEQRMFLDALTTIQIPASVVASCTGVEVGDGSVPLHFDSSHVYTMGQSMGALYVNYFSAVEGRVLAAMPSGSGGYWSHYILISPLYPNIETLIAALLGTNAQLTFMHPALSLFETVWEPVDPMIYMPRLARRPLPGHSPVSTYKPVAIGDSYFREATFDAMSLAFGQPQAGDIVWPSMQDALALADLDGLRSYPIADNLMSADGTAYTSAVVQYEGDGIFDPHAIYAQLETVKHQYSCFFGSHLRTGTAQIVAPAPLSAPCE